ncbi:MAG: hypothetical protein ACJ748_13060 [Flavisolibacter sp.]
MRNIHTDILILAKENCEFLIDVLNKNIGVLNEKKFHCFLDKIEEADHLDTFARLNYSYTIVLPELSGP